MPDSPWDKVIGAVIGKGGAPVQSLMEPPAWLGPVWSHEPVVGWRYEREEYHTGAPTVLIITTMGRHVADLEGTGIRSGMLHPAPVS